MIVDQQQTVFDSLRAIAAIGRASFGMRDGLYSVIRDLPQAAPIQHFTPRNSWGFKSTRAFPQLPGALKVRFINPAADWQPDEQIVYDDGFTPANTALYEALDLTAGVTDPDQAWRDGRYDLAQARLRPETYELSVDVENLVCQRGDLVFVSHDVPAMGPRRGTRKGSRGRFQRQRNRRHHRRDLQLRAGAGLCDPGPPHRRRFLSFASAFVLLSLRERARRALHPARSRSQLRSLPRRPRLPPATS